MSLVVIIGGPDFLRVGFVGIDVDHPTEEVGTKDAAGRIAGFLGGDRAYETELCIRAEVLVFLAFRRGAEVDVLVPARDAERDAVVQLVFRGGYAVGVHGADEFVAAVWRFGVEQRGGFEGIEVEGGGDGVVVFGEVVLGLRDVGEENLVAVGEGFAVVLIGGHGGLCGSDDGVGFLLVAWLGRAEGRHVHVAGHVGHVAIGCGYYGVGGGLRCDERGAEQESDGETKLGERGHHDSPLRGFYQSLKVPTIRVRRIRLEDLLVEESWLRAQQLVHEGLVVVHDAARDLKGRGVFVGDGVDDAVVETEDLGAGRGEQDGRVGGDEELRVGVLADGVVEEDEEGELALGRECGFGFVEEEEAGAAELVVEDGEKGFAVRTGVEGATAIAVEDRGEQELAGVLGVEFVEAGGDVEEGFGAEEEAFAGADGSEAEAEGSGEGVGVVGGQVGLEGEVAVAAVEREAVAEGDGFKESGFAGAVFAGEEGEAGVGEVEGCEGLDGGDGEGVAGGVLDAMLEELDGGEHGQPMRWRMMFCTSRLPWMIPRNSTGSRLDS